MERSDGHTPADSIHSQRQRSPTPATHWRSRDHSLLVGDAGPFKFHGKIRTGIFGLDEHTGAIKQWNPNGYVGINGHLPADDGTTITFAIHGTTVYTYEVDGGGNSAPSRIQALRDEPHDTSRSPVASKTRIAGIRQLPPTHPRGIRRLPRHRVGALDFGPVLRHHS